MQRTLIIIAAPVLVAFVAGAVSACSSGRTGEEASPAASAAGSAGETGGVAAPEATPTNPPPSPQPPPGQSQTPSDWLAGRITSGGTGPCYGFETDDGSRCALYSADGISVESGAAVRIRLQPLLLRIYCGPGQHAQLVEIEIVE